jgi:hypothetical protein
MCKLAFHNCAECGEEYSCDQPNSECPVLHGYLGPCEKCEWWQEESHREEARYKRMMYERQDDWDRWHEEN